jgi:D-beta-D-heptose 7-phosphate kinase/D-beta-D-heptose 1-phosphate adenosyltransferase
MQMNIEAFKTKRILVVGDIMLDNYYKGAVNRISPEAPVPVFLKQKETSVLGGAANVAANLIAAGQNASIMSIIGKDANGEELKRLIEAKGIGSELLFKVNRKTTVKTRFLADNNQQLLRMDVEDSSDVSEEVAKTIIEQFCTHILEYNLIILSDYKKGFLTYYICQSVISAAKENNIPVLIDVKDEKTEKYCGATLLKPNRNELKQLSGMNVGCDEEIVLAAEKLRVKCACKYVLATLGSKGMVLIGDGIPFFLPAMTREVYDVSGAGDTTIAYLSVCIANGMSIRESMEIANYAASIQVGKVGTSSVELREVVETINESKSNVNHKILDDKEILSFRVKNTNKKIVFTNGCFDILHVGHKRYLQEAARLGDILIVGVNSDASVKRLKGPSRPVNPEQDRMEILSALGFVDYVVLFDEDTPYELIKTIQPDILVKGGDYSIENVVGRDIVEARGGRVELIQFVEGKSTSNIINKINTQSNE